MINRLRRRPREGAGAAAPSQPVIAPVPSPDQAWKALSLVVDWIKHAETKAAALLAATGVAGGVLYNLVKNQSDPSRALNIIAGVAGTLLFLAGMFAALALKPRLRAKEEPTSSLYYHHIARKHTRAAGSAVYSQLVLELTSDGEKLVNEVATQIWANAHVASEKYRWINLSMAMFLSALPFLSGVAVVITMGWNHG